MHWGPVVNNRRDPLFVMYSLTVVSICAFFINDLSVLLVMFGTQAVVGCVVLGQAALWRLGALTMAGLGVAFVNAIASGDVMSGATAAMRVLAVVTGGALIFPTIDATALADGLAQRWRLPHRFVLGALVAMRQVETFRHDMRSIALARRIQGLGADSAVGQIRQFPSLVFTFLVSALRQGSRLSLAMTARGLSASPRTWSRFSAPTSADWVMLVAAVVFALGSVALSAR